MRGVIKECPSVCGVYLSAYLSMMSICASAVSVVSVYSASVWCLSVCLSICLLCVPSVCSVYLVCCVCVPSVCSVYLVCCVCVSIRVLCLSCLLCVCPFCRFSLLSILSIPIYPVCLHCVLCVYVMSATLCARSIYAVSSLSV
jgi:hypothetical protein